MVHPRPATPRERRWWLDRLDALPLRPDTARAVLAEASCPGELPADSPPSPDLRKAFDLDPGWALTPARPGPPTDWLDAVHRRPWWLAPGAEGAAALDRLWRHAVAVRNVARRLAVEAGDNEPEAVGRAGLMHALPLWAMATIDPGWLASWLAETDPERRRSFERQSLGSGVGALGRALANRWRLDPLTADAAWLATADDLKGAAEGSRDRLEFVQRAVQWAERTPWALGWLSPPDPASLQDPRLKLLVAEVQVACSAPFVAPDATPREERFAREVAGLRLQVAGLRATSDAQTRFLDAFAASPEGETPEAWAERAGRVWCEEPGVSAARVEWGTSAETAEPSRPPGRESEVRLDDGGHLFATVRLRTGSAHAVDPEVIRAVRPAWAAWARSVAHRDRSERQLDGLLDALRVRRDREEPTLRDAKLAALAEFAAGAGHELNNPLAVIVGRTQLLMARAGDPETARSLRAILTQAQRAHRILRDLMYVARPPEPRPRSCLPDEILRLAVRDARADGDDRRVRLLVEDAPPGPRAWADPDALRHLADTLIRNALDATPEGGTVRVATAFEHGSLRWTVHDSGRGITAHEGLHLFDPFYCGRQAGRGLGMGLPRAARVVQGAGGELRWQSAPGQGTTFTAKLPVVAPPPPHAPESENPRGGSNPPSGPA